MKQQKRTLTIRHDAVASMQRSLDRYMTKTGHTVATKAIAFMVNDYWRQVDTVARLQGTVELLREQLEVRVDSMKELEDSLKLVLEQIAQGDMFDMPSDDAGARSGRDH